MNEDNQYDHLETVYINLTPEMTSNKSEPSVKNFAASPAITHKASNSQHKPLSRNSLYLGLSEANQRAIAALELSVDTDTATVLEQLLFARGGSRVVVE